MKLTSYPQRAAILILTTAAHEAGAAAQVFAPRDYREGARVVVSKANAWEVVGVSQGGLVTRLSASWTFDMTLAACVGGAVEAAEQVTA